MAYAYQENGNLHIGQVPQNSTELSLPIPAKASYVRFKAVGGAVTLKAAASGATHTLNTNEYMELFATHGIALSSLTFLVTTGGATTLDVLAILGNID